MHHSPRFLQLVDDAKARIQECSAEQAKNWLETRPGLHLIDVREESEFASGRAAGAVHLGRGILERDIEARISDLSAPIVLYCGGGYRSALAADNLMRMGYTNVYSMQGGIRAWRELGYPEEK